MIKIELIRSGGMLGKNLQADGVIDMAEESILEKLKSIAPVDNNEVRDGFYHSITVNGSHTFPIDINLLKGKLKKAVAELEANLKVKK